ncbi:MAG: TonB-dependent receptor plug domain-containing protein [bacterium]
MYSHRTAAFAVLLVSLWSLTALAQSPVAVDPDAPGGASDSDTDSNPTKATGNEHEAQTAKPVPREERGPRLTTLDEVVVEADKPLSAASSQVIRARDYALRPHSTTQEILNNVPGLTVVQHQGGGKALQYLIRGFDADHGTDFAVFTDGIPTNLVTHAHGQGYADINYLIPETVNNLQLFKGPYFVELGDFALAGALKITTKDEFKQNFALAEGGSFDTQRYVLGGSVPLTWAKTLLAAEVYNSNGPFENPQNYWRYNVFGKLTLAPTADQKLQLLGSVYDGDWDGSGQIPARVVGSGPGKINRFGSLDPTEGGSTDRENLSVIYNYKPSADETWSAQAYGSRYHLRLFSDFTYFQTTGLRFYTEPGTNQYVDRCAGNINCPLTPTGIALDQFIPGDGIEQDDSRLLFGGFVQYNRFYNVGNVPVLGDVPMQSEFGITTRYDSIDIALQRQVRRNPFYTINKNGVQEQSVSGYWGQQIFFNEWARFEGGVRGDVFFFDVRDRLPQQGPDPNFEPVPIKGNNVKGLASPKANLVLGPWYNTEYYLNFGYGYHSNDARAVVKTGTDGLAQGYGYEAGARTRQFDRLDVATALWLIDVDSELVFSGDGGDVDAPVVGNNFIAGPASRRWGIDFETRYQFTDWLFADYDLTFADPRLRNGDAIPLAPTLVMNGGLTTEFNTGILTGFAAALRFRYLGPRPANESRTLEAQGWELFDILLRYRWRNVEASLAFLNITDTAWREAQFGENTCVNQVNAPNPTDYANPPATAKAACPTSGSRPQRSTVNSEPIDAAGIEGVSFTPGNPFGVRGGIQIFF